jgi:hypothetical protein
MWLHFIRRRTVFFPTPLGWLCLFLLVLTPPAFWWFCGETFLSHTRRAPADVLVVESWIGIEGIRAAGDEFIRGGYRYIATTGGLTGRYWSQQRSGLSEIAGQELAQMGIPEERIISTPDLLTDNQRTYTAAVAVWRKLHAASIQTDALNIFTVGAHARRSCLVFAKVFGSETDVGVISWTPPGYGTGPWWRSSYRAEEFIKETVGYAFEALLNSGRESNSPSR